MHHIPKAQTRVVIQVFDTAGVLPGEAGGGVGGQSLIADCGLTLKAPRVSGLIQHPENLP